MIKAIQSFPLYNDDKELINYKIGDVVAVSDKALIKKLILSGKCKLYDHRKKEVPASKKIIGDYEKKIDPPAKKKKTRK